MTAPSRASSPPCLMKVTEPLATGWPSRVTERVTDDLPSLQPSSTRQHVRNRSVRCTAELFADRLAAVHAAERSPSREVDGIGDESHGAIGEGGIHAAGMPAAGRVHAGSA